jgi:hypothetical protein
MIGYVPSARGSYELLGKLFLSQIRNMSPLTVLRDPVPGIVLPWQRAFNRAGSGTYFRGIWLAGPDPLTRYSGTNVANEPRDDRIAGTVRSVGSLWVLGGCDLVGIYIADLQMARAD